MTTISWTDETWNPTDGCQRVSEGCRNCYAERFAGRFCGPGQRYEGIVERRLRVISDDDQHLVARWTGEGRLDAGKLAKPLRWKKPRRIFVNSMSDLFFEKFTNEQIAAVFGVMAACPQHTFQVLTKRAGRMREWFEWVAEIGTETCRAEAFCHLPADFRDPHDGMFGEKPWPLPNVWLGCSVENQDAADERIPELLRTPAVVRFLSCEPLLGPVDLTDRLGIWTDCPDCGRDVSLDEDGCCAMCGLDAYRWGVDWVISGCESGPGARPCDVAWLRSLRDQCAAAGVAFFCKQAEESIFHDEYGFDPNPDGTLDEPIRFGDGSSAKGRRPGGNHVIELPYLDGVQHAAFPEVSNA
jgi:protein gp37